MIRFFKITAGTAAALLLMFVAWVAYEITQLPMLPEGLDRLDLSPPTVIYAADGRPLHQVRTRTIVLLDRISPYFRKAILMVEDRRFYEHEGIDKIGLLRAVWQNMVTGGNAGGGSTITQQLAKNLFLSFERSYRRKIRDILLALQFERRYPKDTILEAYCNQINFGSGAYGIENASLTYFGKHASELNLTESVLLAAIPQSPNYYNLYIDAERVKDRYIYILNRLNDYGWISRPEFEEAREYSFTLKNFLSRSSIAPHFIDMVTQHVINKYDEELLLYGGLRIYTTLDIEMQEKAVEAVQEGMIQLDSRQGKDDYRLVKREERSLYPEAALVAIDQTTGAVRALIGGRNSSGDYFNRAVSARRSPGSSFKPLLYLTSFVELEMDASAVMVDSPVVIDVPGGEWIPDNFERDFYGPVALKYGFMRSINTVAAQLIERVGPDKVVEMASKLGITTQLEEVPSLALGSNGVSLLELTSAYGTIAAGGVYTVPYFIGRIEDASGEVLEENAILLNSRVIDEDHAYLVIDLLKGGLEPRGTGVDVRRRGFTLPAGGKTGTTNDHRDALFAGITPDLTTTVWVGYDNYDSIFDQNGIGITGSTGALPVWTAFMKKIEDNLTGRDFPIPAGIAFKYIDIATGQEVSEYDPNSVRVAVLR
ncbi:transglycosylase domain-containing protein [candidate division KSB1 bacterium]